MSDFNTARSEGKLQNDNHATDRLEEQLVEGLDNRGPESFRQEKKWGLDRISDRMESWQKLRIPWG